MVVTLSVMYQVYLQIDFFQLVTFLNEKIFEYIFKKSQK